LAKFARHLILFYLGLAWKFIVNKQFFLVYRHKSLESNAEKKYFAKSLLTPFIGNFGYSLAGSKRRPVAKLLIIMNYF